jgi:Uma2 family endonuclease
MGTTTALVTFEEFERFPEEEDERKLELLDGEVPRMPPAEFRHGRISLRIFLFLVEALRMLHAKGQCQDLGEVLHEIGYRIAPCTWLIPDVSITHAGQAEGKYLKGSPALAIEVISESNTVRTMHRKRRRYFENGCREAWVVYPETTGNPCQVPRASRSER